MKVIAEQGTRVYLLLVGDDRARVLDLHQGKLFPAYNVHSILARGYWESSTVPLTTIIRLLANVDIMDDYPPRPGTMRVDVHDIDSGSKLAVVESEAGRIRMWENVDPSAMPTVNPGMDEDCFDHIESWTELVSKQVRYGPRTYSPEDGDEFLFALIDSQPSNIVHYAPYTDTWKFEEHQKWREENGKFWNA